MAYVNSAVPPPRPGSGADVGVHPLSSQVGAAQPSRWRPDDLPSSYEPTLGSDGGRRSTSAATSWRRTTASTLPLPGGTSFDPGSRRQVGTSPTHASSRRMVQNKSGRGSSARGAYAVDVEEFLAHHLHPTVMRTVIERVAAESSGNRALPTTNRRRPPHNPFTASHFSPAARVGSLACAETTAARAAQAEQPGGADEASILDRTQSATDDLQPTSANKFRELCWEKGQDLNLRPWVMSPASSPNCSTPRRSPCDSPSYPSRRARTKCRNPPHWRGTASGQWAWSWTWRSPASASKPE